MEGDDDDVQKVKAKMGHIDKEMPSRPGLYNVAYVSRLGIAMNGAGRDSSVFEYAFSS